MDNLFILLLVPLLGAMILAFVKTPSTAKWLALGFSVLQLLLTLPFICKFNPDATVQFTQSFAWISRFTIHFHIAVDGISLPLLVLTNGLIPWITLSSFAKKYTGNFYALLLFMQMGLLLVFMAQDAFTFYVGWEIALIPIYFICALWGDGDRIRITMKFFIYTFLGSLLMLLAILYLYQQTASKDFEWASFRALSLPEDTQRWIFWAFFLAFAIKIPLFPFHSWQPDTYTHAPSAGTMLLAGIMLKMGIYGLIRWLIPIAPLGVAAYGPIALILALVGLVYASIIAFKQNDAKRLLAYSSIAHVGLISAGVFAWNTLGLQGAVLQMVNHGISVVGLFYVIDILQARAGSRSLADLGGLAKRMPRLSVLFLLLIMGAIGLPLTNGFIGEFLLLKGLYQVGIWYAAVAGLTLIFGAVYMLRLYQKTMLGPLAETYVAVKDIQGREFVLLIIAAIAVLYLGIFPNSVLQLSEAAVGQLTEQIQF